MNHKNDIPYPTAEQKKRAVAQIVRQTKPPRVGAIRFLVDAYREIGMATVLRNSIGIFGLSAAVFAVGIALALTEYDPVFMEKRDVAPILAIFFFGSPLVLLLTDFLYRLREKPLGVYEMQSAYKYTARHLILLRMPLFSLGTAAVDLAAALAWCGLRGTEYLPQMIGLIASGVMLYSLLNVALFNRFGLTGCIVCAVLWGGFTMGFAELPPAQRYALMTGIPFAVHMLSGAAMAAILTLLVRIFYQRPMYFIRNA